MRVSGALCVMLASLPALLLGASGSMAHAQEPAQEHLAPPRIVLLQPAGVPVRPGLEPSLRIQLRDVELHTYRVDLPADVPSRLSTASAIADAQAADWVVWAEDVQTDPNVPADQAVLYVVGRRHGRALIEVVRVPAGEGPEVDRSLALKVDELIGERDGAAYALGNKELPAERSGASPQESRVRLWTQLGAQLAFEGNAGATGDLTLAIGPGLFTPGLVIAVPLELTIGLTRSVEQDGNRVEWTESGAALWIRALARLHPMLLLGGGIGGKLGFTDADGVAASGRRGSSTERLPALLVSLDAELVLSEDFGAQLMLGLEQRTQRQRFFVEGDEIADTGRSIPFARVSLVWHAW